MIRPIITIKKRFLAQIRHKVDFNTILYTIFYDNIEPNAKNDEYPLLRCGLPNGNCVIITTHNWTIFFENQTFVINNNQIIGFSENSYEQDLKGEKTEFVELEVLTDNNTYKFQFESGSATIGLMYCLRVIIDFYKK
jgi:hypothetical protein